jgi:hypothetical protein
MPVREPEDASPMAFCSWSDFHRGAHMKRQGISWSVLGLMFASALVTAAVLAGTSAARDDDRWGGHRGFDKRSIKGAYGYNSSLGWLVATGPNQPVSPPVPFAGMGRIVFDGQGGCEVTSIGNLNGQSVPSTASSCRYDVNPDGTGTAEAVFPGAPIADPIPIAFVITDQAQELRALNTRFIVGTFTARRQ